MITLSKQFRKYFVITAMVSIAFITIITNIGINLFFTDYIRETRSRDDEKVVQYVEQVYIDYNGLNSQSFMSIMHYAYSDNLTIRIKDIDNRVIWDSSTSDNMHSMMQRDKNKIDTTVVYNNYSYSYLGKQIGSIDVGRPKSIISSIEDKQFLSTINGIFAIAFIFTLGVAILTSSNISRKFLKPIYKIRENANYIKNGQYKDLNEVITNTFELNDLSISMNELADRLDYQEHLRKRMTTDMAHELRTPIATIQSHIEAFIDGVWVPSVEKLSIVHDEVNRLTKLINELSDLSLIESDDIKLNKSSVNMSLLLNNILKTFEPLFISKNININNEIPKNIELSGDEEILQRVFINILSNAFKYTNENGNVRINVVQIGDVINIVIEDTGIGIPKEDIKHIFERFYRSDISRNRVSGGTGIGLTISKALIQAHGGNIKVESEEGIGTRVIITLNKSE
ncbi:hypothetical protein GC105_01430 [Alkalibaculum sp. M08DMB]|uniref:histidine kinase n=1 Tax=Alkalibaculum sporogenes TaxID=2655001 RepID=A0A6A7K547_9FIRM|nr:HAMP domain-containing sensor histidine kinase [Alkalibaculum sporogenes]MPW24454.1 hypothetical protein [Alkalibaculum sporogenes]